MEMTMKNNSISFQSPDQSMTISGGGIFIGFRWWFGFGWNFPDFYVLEAQRGRVRCSKMFPRGLNHKIALKQIKKEMALFIIQHKGRSLSGQKDASNREATAGWPR